MDLNTSCRSYSPFNFSRGRIHPRFAHVGTSRPTVIMSKYPSLTARSLAMRVRSVFSSRTFQSSSILGCRFSYALESRCMRSISLLLTLAMVSLTLPSGSVLRGNSPCLFCIFSKVPSATTSFSPLLKASSNRVYPFVFFENATWKSFTARRVS